MNFDEFLNTARESAAKIDELGQKLGKDLSSYFPTEILQLNDCLDSYSAFKSMIGSIVDSASGDMNLDGWNNLFSNFDKDWDKFAAEYNEIFERMNPGQQQNVLETFARTNFGDAIFGAGSVIKNETPNILGGIIGFRKGLDAFKGSYRSPQEAANKIRNGVQAIVNSTAQVAGAAKNVATYLRTLSGNHPVIDNVLSKFENGFGVVANLPDTRIIAGSIGALSSAATGIGAFNSIKGTLNCVKSGDYIGAITQGKAAYENVRATVQNLKGTMAGLQGKGKQQLSQGVSTGGAAPLSAANPEEPEEPEEEEEEEQGSSAFTDSYVVSTATIRCTFGDKLSRLTVLPIRTVWLSGQPQGNIADHEPFLNIAPFGRCHTTAFPDTGAATAANHGHLTPMPCRPGTYYPWERPKYDVLIKGAPALLKSSVCKCCYGGVITVTDDGQSPKGSPDLNKDSLMSPDELDLEAEPLSVDDVLDGVQLALDAAGMVPFFGAVPDLANAVISACRGNWMDAGLSVVAAIPGAGDAVGAAKLVKNGAKMAQKANKAQKAAKTADKVADISKANKNAGKVTDVSKANKSTDNVTDLNKYRANKEMQQQRAQAVERGEVADMEAYRGEWAKTGTDGKAVRVDQPTSISRTDIRNDVGGIGPTNKPSFGQGQQNPQHGSNRFGRQSGGSSGGQTPGVKKNENPNSIIDKAREEGYLEKVEGPGDKFEHEKIENPLEKQLADLRAQKKKFEENLGNQDKPTFGLQEQ